MKRHLVLLCLLLSPLLLAADRDWASLDALKSAVNQRVREATQRAGHVGVYVMTVDDGREVYSFRGEEMRVLASNTKLFTSAAALDHLGPGFFFETSVEVRGEIFDGVLRGDLGVVGGGDPNISGRQYDGDSLGAFREWAAALRALGIRRISGELMLAKGFFDDQWVHPDWPKDQLDRWYQAPVAALSFNDNCALVKVEPVGGRGGGPRVSLVPQVPFMSLANRVKLAAKARLTNVRIGRDPRAPTLEARRTIEVDGQVGRSGEVVDKWITVDDPVTYFGAALRQALHESGIVLDGEVVVVDRLNDAAWRPVVTYRNDLITTLEVVNKRSQNFYAESVFKLLGARFCGRGTWPSGVRVVSEFLESAGLDPDAFELVDGSGMSRGNRASAHQMTLLLRHMFFHQWGGEFVRTLPYSGESDLRWAKRLAEPPFRGNVVAKTGSLNGVSSLSGYAKGVSGTVYAFSILMNDSHQNWRSQQAQDAIVRALIENG